MRTYLQGLRADWEEEQMLRDRYQSMQDLVHNAFRPLYSGDDLAAVTALKQARLHCVVDRRGSATFGGLLLGRGLFEKLIQSVVGAYAYSYLKG